MTVSQPHAVVEKVGIGAVITLCSLIKLKRKKTSTYYMPDPAARFWGQRGVRPHSGTQAAQSDGKTDPDQVS